MARFGQQLAQKDLICSTQQIRLRRSTAEHTLSLSSLIASICAMPNDAVGAGYLEYPLPQGVDTLVVGDGTD